MSRGGKGRKVPQRTCVGCREVLGKRELIRVVRSDDRVQVDPTGKMPGRGAYLHDRKDCWKRGLDGSLAHALKIQISPTDWSELEAFMLSLPDEQHE